MIRLIMFSNEKCAISYEILLCIENQLPAFDNFG